MIYMDIFSNEQMDFRRISSMKPTGFCRQYKTLKRKQRGFQESGWTIILTIIIGISSHYKDDYPIIIPYNIHILTIYWPSLTIINQY